MDTTNPQKTTTEIKKPGIGKKIFLLIIFIVFVFIGMLLGYIVKQSLDNKKIVTESLEVTETEKINDGIIMAPDKSFSVYVGEKMLDRVVISGAENADTSGSFYFCYKLNDANYESWTCPVGQSPLFTINRYTKAQFDTMLELPFFEATADEGYRTEGGHYYTLSHPNGDLPEEILPNLPAYNWGEYYTTVLDSLVAE